MDFQVHHTETFCWVWILEELLQYINPHRLRSISADSAEALLPMLTSYPGHHEMVRAILRDARDGRDDVVMPVSGWDNLTYGPSLVVALAYVSVYFRPHGLRGFLQEEITGLELGTPAETINRVNRTLTPIFWHGSGRLQWLQDHAGCQITLVDVIHANYSDREFEQLLLTNSLSLTDPVTVGQLLPIVQQGASWDSRLLNLLRIVVRRSERAVV